MGQDSRVSTTFPRVRTSKRGYAVDEVEDFLDFYFRTYHWYTFNLADSAIVIGTGLIILQVLLGEVEK